MVNHYVSFILTNLLTVVSGGLNSVQVKSANPQEEGGRSGRTKRFGNILTKPLFLWT